MPITPEQIAVTPKPITSEQKQTITDALVKARDSAQLSLSYIQEAEEALKTDDWKAMAEALTWMVDTDLAEAVEEMLSTGDLGEY